jgi:aryl-alcohol dehydrogenase-like predicted oxidoreductase
MEYRKLGASGLMVPELSLGAGLFAPDDVLSKNNVNAKQAQRLVDICLDRGANMFDTSNSYWNGHSQQILGETLKGRRHRAIISSKAGQILTGGGPNDGGASRHHLTGVIDESLKRLGTDYIDIFQLHTFDALTPPEETLATLDDFIRAGKIRYIGVSNMPSWALMKSLATADRLMLPRYVVHQVYYSLIGRDYEWDLMPLAKDQGLAAAVWSPLGWGRLTGRLKRDAPLPADSRLQWTANMGPRVDQERLFRVLDVLEEIAAETDRLVPQIAINWLLHRPTVATVLLGSRTEEQLLQTLDATGWALSAEQVARLDAASKVTPSYPADFYERAPMHRNPAAV